MYTSGQMYSQSFLSKNFHVLYTEKHGQIPQEQSNEHNCLLKNGYKWTEKKKKTYSKLTIVRKITVVNKYTAKGGKQKSGILDFFPENTLRLIHVRMCTTILGTQTVTGKRKKSRIETHYVQEEKHSTADHSLQLFECTRYLL